MGISKDVVSAVMPYAVIGGMAYLGYKYIKESGFNLKDFLGEILLGQTPGHGIDNPRYDPQFVYETSPSDLAIDPTKYEIPGSWNFYKPDGSINPPPGYPGHMTDADMLISSVPEVQRSMESVLQEYQGYKESQEFTEKWFSIR